MSEGPGVAVTPAGRRQMIQGLVHGPAVVAAGAVLLGIGSYVFLTFAARSLGPSPFGELSTLWALVFGFVAGLWYPFEQLLTRLVAASTHGAAADIRRVAIIQAATVAVAQVVVVIALLVGAGALLGRSPGLAAGLMLSVVTLAAASFQRGLLIGSRRFGWAAAQQGVDGAVRAVGALALAGFGSDVGAYGVLLGLAPLVGVVACVPGTPRDFVEGTARAWRTLMRDAFTLVAGTYVSIVLLNVGPLVVRSSGTAEATGRFMAIFVVARLPLFFAPPVVAGLLPSLVHAHATRSRAGYRRMVAATAAAVAVVAGVGCLVLGVLGPWVSRTFFGSEYEPTVGVSVLLALSSAGFVVAMVLQGALVAAGRPRAVAGPWLLAALTFAALCLLPGSIETRVAFAYLVASFVSVTAMAVAVRRAS